MKSVYVPPDETVHTSKSQHLPTINRQHSADGKKDFGYSAHKSNIPPPVI